MPGTAHVHLAQNADGTFRLTVDDVDISQSVSEVLIRVRGGDKRSEVFVTLRASAVDVDLPDALVVGGGRD